MNYRKFADLALRVLHKSLPDLARGADLLFIPPVEHLLRCFAFETSPEMKGTAYFWRVVMPLYRPPNFLILNYGDRLLGGERVSLAESELDRTIDRLVRVISQGELDCLKKIQSPQEFLRQIDWNCRPSSPNYRLDLALTHYLTGNVPACREILEQVASAILSPRWADSVKLAQELVEELRVDPSALDRRIEAWERRNMSSLRLEPRARRTISSKNG
jgi:hypothetical protein